MSLPKDILHVFSSGCSMTVVTPGVVISVVTPGVVIYVVTPGAVVSVVTPGVVVSVVTPGVVIVVDKTEFEDKLETSCCTSEVDCSLFDVTYDTVIGLVDARTVTGVLISSSGIEKR